MRRWSTYYDGYGGRQSFAKSAPPANPKHPDRIDFTVLSDGGVIITKMRRDTSNLQYPRAIPLPDGSSTKTPGFDLEGALTWCEDHGYVVRRWPGGARAWKGSKPWPIRTGYGIFKARQRAEREGKGFSLDFAYDG